MIFARNVAKLIEYIFESGYTCTLGEAFRTVEQARLYAQKGKGSLNSLHCKRLAIDLNIFSPAGEYLTDTKDYETFGKYWESLNSHNVWGGNFISGALKGSDGNHFQMSDKSEFNKALS